MPADKITLYETHRSILQTRGHAGPVVFTYVDSYDSTKDHSCHWKYTWVIRNNGLLIQVRVRVRVWVPSVESEGESRVIMWVESESESESRVTKVESESESESRVTKVESDSEPRVTYKI